MTNENNQVDEAQIGRILHFVVDKGYKLQCRPAIVVEDWPDQGKPGYVNLQVFVDGSNDSWDVHSHKLSPELSTEATKITAHTKWETSVLPNHAVKAVRSWHWPRECASLLPAELDYTSKAGNKFHHNHRVGVIDIHNCAACITMVQDEKEVEATNA